MSKCLSGTRPYHANSVISQSQARKRSCSKLATGLRLHHHHTPLLHGGPHLDSTQMYRRANPSNVTPFSRDCTPGPLISPPVANLANEHANRSHSCVGIEAMAMAINHVESQPANSHTLVALSRSRKAWGHAAPQHRDNGTLAIPQEVNARSRCVRLGCYQVLGYTQPHPTGCGCQPARRPTTQAASVQGGDFLLCRDSRACTCLAACCPATIINLQAATRRHVWSIAVHGGAFRQVSVAMSSDTCAPDGTCLHQPAQGSHRKHSGLTPMRALQLCPDGMQQMIMRIVAIAADVFGDTGVLFSAWLFSWTEGIK
jgi:hypothetical protein